MMHEQVDIQFVFRGAVVGTGTTVVVPTTGDTVVADGHIYKVVDRCWYPDKNLVDIKLK